MKIREIDEFMELSNISYSFNETETFKIKMYFLDKTHNIIPVTRRLDLGSDHSGCKTIISVRVKRRIRSAKAIVAICR